MDWLTFIAEMAKALAWPAVIGAGLYMFGGELVKLLSEITGFKFGGVEVNRQIKGTTTKVEIAEAISEANAARLPSVVANEEVTVADSVTVRPVIDPVNRLMVLVEPIASVLQAWRNVEMAIDFVLEQNGVKPSAQVPDRIDALQLLRMDSRIDHSTLEALHGMRDVRNKIAAGGHPIDSDSAEQYVSNAERIIKLLFNMRSRS